MGNKSDLVTPTNSQADTSAPDQRENRSDGGGQSDQQNMTYEQRAERRSTPRAQTPFYKVMLGLNIVGWLALVVGLILFHYARPDFISGVQEYWGIEGDTTWSQSHLSALTMVLLVCLVVSSISMVMRARRNRRQSDSFGINLIILFAIAAISLLTIAATFGL